MLVSLYSSLDSCIGQFWLFVLEIQLLADCRGEKGSERFQGPTGHHRHCIYLAPLRHSGHSDSIWLPWSQPVPIPTPLASIVAACHPPAWLETGSLIYEGIWGCAQEQEWWEGHKVLEWQHCRLCLVYAGSRMLICFNSEILGINICLAYGVFQCVGWTFGSTVYVGNNLTVCKFIHTLNSHF